MWGKKCYMGFSQCEIISHLVDQIYILIKHCQAFLNRKKNFHSSCLIWQDCHLISLTLYLLASQSWINIGIFTSFVFCLILSSHMMICSVQHTSMAALLLVLNSTSYKGWHKTHWANHVWYSCRSMQNAETTVHTASRIMNCNTYSIHALFHGAALSL